MSKLVIVESPAKAKTIKKYLGKDFEVTASMGHVRDLPAAKLSVDVKNDFAPKYAIIKNKEKLVKELKAQVEKSEKVYLATDPDREGEAIAWHLANTLGIPLDKTLRVSFNEITPGVVKAAIKEPRNIDMNLVNSQQTRRLLDRIVGYKLSPFLWKNIRGGSSLSAGRVQSVAVKLIVDREREIEAFVPEEYWSIDAKLCEKGETSAFSAKLQTKNGEKIEIRDGKTANAIVEELHGVPFVVGGIKKSLRKKQPAPPFITSTLQQEASLRLSFQPREKAAFRQEKLTVFWQIWEFRLIILILQKEDFLFVLMDLLICV